MIINGPTSSGKTTFLLRLLEHYREMIEPQPRQILYCYGEYHSFVPELEKSGVTVYAGVPNDEIIRECEKPLLLILDDLMLAVNERFVSDLFTKKSHHQNIGVIFLTQNLFEKNLKVARNNSQYIVLMRAPNALLQIQNLGTQLFPNRRSYFLDAYNNATERPYGYLLVNMHPNADPSLKLRTNIFPDDDKRIVFISKNAS